MFRFLVVVACLAVPVLSYSTGAPDKICTNGLLPEHSIDPQTSPVPYSFSGDSSAKSGKVSITLGGGDFLGFAVQAHDGAGKPIGQFKVVDSAHSQTLKCSGAHDTLTHKKIDPDAPLTRLPFEWVAPKDYSGTVKFIGTVAQNGGVFWVGKVLKEVKI